MPDNITSPPPPVSGSFFTSKPFIILVVSGILLCGGIMFFQSLSDKTTLSFSFTLDGKSLTPDKVADVKVDGQPFTNGNKVKMGRHALTVQLQDTEPLEEHFWVLFGAKNLGTLPLESSKGSLVVSVTPSPAIVVVQRNGETVSQGAAPLTSEKLPVGNYSLLIKRGEYEENRVVVVQRQQRTEAKVELNLGTVDLSAEPAGAEFDLSGKGRRWQGKLPAHVDDIPAGDYALLLSKGNYTEEHSLSITGQHRLDKNLVMNLGSLDLSSDPPDAEFELSGNGQRWRGKLPIRIDDVPCKTYSLTVTRKGWELNSDISVSQGDITSNKTTFAYGSLEITSDPAGLVISTNGVEIGKTPVSLLELKPGQYTLTASDGENDLIAKVGIASDEAVKHFFTFHYGAVQLSSTPTGATVIRKGKEIGKTPLILNHIPAGETMIELRLQDYVSTNVLIQTEEGVTNQLSAKLISENYLRAMKLAHDAFGTGQLAQSQSYLALALTIQPDDSAAIQLRDEVARAVAEVEIAKAKAEEAVRAEQANAKAREMASLMWLDFQKVISDCTDTKQVQYPVQMVDISYETYRDSNGKIKRREVKSAPYTVMQTKSESTFNQNKFSANYAGRTFGFNCPGNWSVSKVDKDGTIIFKGERSGSLGLVFHTISASPPSNNQQAFKSLERGQKIRIKGIISKYTSGFIGPTLFFENVELLDK